jgi:CheY-like chemotaxis protein
VKKILIVDDEEMVRNVLTLILGELQFDSDAALCAEEALGLIDRKSYDVVFTDYQMPGMNGIELIRHIRQKSPRSAVVLMTGCLDAEALRSSGADVCLRKPFSAHMVKETLDRAFREGPGVESSGFPGRE